MGRALLPVMALAARQHGIVSRGQVLAAGVSSSALDRLLAGGALVPVARGIYRFAGTPPGWSGRLLAACLAVEGVASHRSAAALFGIRGFGRGVPEVTVARTRRSHRDGIRVHQSLDLHLAEIRTIEAIPVTGPARLAVDLGAVVPQRKVESALHDMVSERLLTWDEVAVAVMRHSRRGRRGVGAARRIVEGRHGGTVGDSVLESTVLAAILDAGFPRPETQVELGDAQGFIARVDACWPDHGVVVEADGREFHLGEHAFEADRRKRNRLRSHGWVVLEVTWRMIVDERRRFLGELRRALQVHPPGSFDPTPFLGGSSALGIAASRTDGRGGRRGTTGA